MANQVTLFLTGKFGPGGKDWVTGELMSKDATGVKLKGSSIGLDNAVRFYPMVQIQYMEYK